MLKLKRIYDKYKKEDGFRILVDRLWPRGITKKEARIDLWLKDIAPSNELRKWFNHDDLRWKKFEGKYAKELKLKKNLVKIIREKIKEKKIVTLLFGAKDLIHNNAVVLKNLIKRK